MAQVQHGEPKCSVLHFQKQLGNQYRRQGKDIKLRIFLGCCLLFCALMQGCALCVGILLHEDEQPWLCGLHQQL